ncbi:helix-turn-helix domain-containing protein [Anaerosolibacter sp.]|uniref:helix-turn-helix domain-containing protein n=1 Tax=Anaerosolibacter sp. TaxID=1872527 RepID=UPI0039EEDA55
MEIKLVPRIRERRMEKHLSQTELCEIIGMSKSQLSRIENGKTRPTPEVLWRIAKGIGCNVDELYEVSS